VIIIKGRFGICMCTVCVRTLSIFHVGEFVFLTESACINSAQTVIQTKTDFILG